MWFEATQVPFHITRTGDPSRLKAHEEGVRENQRGSEEIEVPAVIFQWKMEAESLKGGIVVSQKYIPILEHKIGKA